MIKVDEKICGFHIIKKGNHEVPFQVRTIFFYSLNVFIEVVRL